MTNAIEMKVFAIKRKAAKATLISRGWEEVGGVMHDGGPTGDFGTLFRKDGVSFWLNFLTIDQLPA
jgi:hypothetical protein